MASKCLSALVMISLSRRSRQTLTNTEVMNEIIELGEWFDVDRYPISTDLWNHPVELLSDGDGIVLTRLEAITEAETSSVYGIVGDASRVVVYRAFTQKISAEQPEPAMRDFWFLNFLRDSKVVPKVHAISARLNAIKLRKRFGGKVYIRIFDPKIWETSVRYIVMERIIGHTFEELSKQYTDQMVPIQLVVDIGIATISALHSLYSHNVIHCDISDRNLMWTLDGAVKLIDFETAMISGPLSRGKCSFRQDMLRSLISIGALMCGKEHKLYVYHRLLESPLLEVSPDISLQLNCPMNRLDGIIRSSVATERPDYEMVINMLREMKDDGK